MAFKYSITLSSFRNIREPLEKTLERLTRQKYDAVEMSGEPHKLDLKSVDETFCSFGIPVCGITRMWGSISECLCRKRRHPEEVGTKITARTYLHIFYQDM